MRIRPVQLIFTAMILIASSVWLPDALASHGSTGANGDPWLGHAMIGTSSNHDRRYHISVVDVAPTQTGDVPGWDYSPAAPLRLRLRWWFDGGGAPGHNATSAKVYLRDLDGNQIGTSVWTATIPDGRAGGPSSGVADMVVQMGYMHLDNNPMDGLAGVATPRVFEIYGELVGGLDHGADSRGARPVGVGSVVPGGPASLTAHARGVFSNNGLRVHDGWSFGDGSSWDASWVTSGNSSGRIIDAQGNRGRIQTGTSTSSSSTARATAEFFDLADAEVNLTHEFCSIGSSPCTADRNLGTDLRIHLRGTGASSSTGGVENAYRLDVESGSTSVKLKKLVNGSASTIGSFTHNPDGVAGPDAGRHGIKFRVEDSIIKAALFPGLIWDGVWDVSVTNDEVVGAGKLQITHYRMSSGTGRAVHLDDLYLSATKGPSTLIGGSLVTTSEAEQERNSCRSIVFQGNAGEIAVQTSDGPTVAWGINMYDPNESGGRWDIDTYINGRKTSSGIHRTEPAPYTPHGSILAESGQRFEVRGTLASQSGRYYHTVPNECFVP